MSEKRHKQARASTREVFGVSYLPGRVVRTGNPRGLCKAGFHDFGKIGKRPAHWETVKEPDGTKRRVYKKGLRARVCRSCSKGEQVHTREGYWINSRGLKL